MQRTPQPTVLVCVDIDECALDSPPCVPCTNVPGSFYCWCGVGFTLQNTTACVPAAVPVPRSTTTSATSTPQATTVTSAEATNGTTNAAEIDSDTSALQTATFVTNADTTSGATDKATPTMPVSSASAGMVALLYWKCVIGRKGSVDFSAPV